MNLEEKFIAIIEKKYNELNSGKGILDKFSKIRHF